MEGIIEALLDIEQQAEAALTAIQREKDRLPARISAETDHVHKLIAQETAAAVKELQESYEKSITVRIQSIQDDNLRQLAAVELHFANHREALRSQLLKRLTRWTT